MVNVLRQVLNVKPHEVIGLCSENRIEFSITMYAAFALNAIVAPLNTTYTERKTDLRKINHSITQKNYLLRNEKLL